MSNISDDDKILYMKEKDKVLCDLNFEDLKNENPRLLYNLYRKYLSYCIRLINCSKNKIIGKELIELTKRIFDQDINYNDREKLTNLILDYIDTQCVNFTKLMTESHYANECFNHSNNFIYNYIVREKDQYSKTEWREIYKKANIIKNPYIEIYETLKREDMKKIKDIECIIRYFIVNDDKLRAQLNTAFNPYKSHHETLHDDILSFEEFAVISFRPR